MPETSEHLNVRLVLHCQRTVPEVLGEASRPGDLHGCSIQQGFLLINPSSHVSIAYSILTQSEDVAMDHMARDQSRRTALLGCAFEDRGRRGVRRAIAYPRRACRLDVGQLLRDRFPRLCLLDSSPSTTRVLVGSFSRSDLVICSSLQPLVRIDNAQTNHEEVSLLPSARSQGRWA